jgi:DNA-binding GntR family transcriptional regulator
MKPVPRELLGAMVPGTRYRASELAESLGISTLQMHEMLCMLVEAGLVRVSSQSSRIVRFERPACEAGSVPLA